MLPLAVIFDMDGLMLDTESLGARAWENVAADHGIAFDAAVTPQLIGRSAADCRELIPCAPRRGLPRGRADLTDIVIEDNDISGWGAWDGVFGASS